MVIVLFFIVQLLLPKPKQEDDILAFTTPLIEQLLHILVAETPAQKLYKYTKQPGTSTVSIISTLYTKMPSNEVQVAGVQSQRPMYSKMPVSWMTGGAGDRELHGVC